MNPYDPPLSALLLADDDATGGVDTITAKYLLSPEHVVETLRRRRSLTWLGQWFRYAAALMFLFFCLTNLFLSFWHYFVSAIILVPVVQLFFWYKIVDFLTRRNFRKSPHCNTQQTIQLSDEGLHSISEVQDSTVKWTAYSRAVIFNDGILLFQSSMMIHWIPDDTLERRSDALNLRKLVGSKLPTNHAMIMQDVRLTWAIGMSSLFILFPFACRVLAMAFDGGMVVMLLPLAFYYMPPASLFGEPWFHNGNLGPSPQSPIGHAIAAFIWGVVGAAIGFVNGQWHYKRQRPKGPQGG